MLMDLFVLMIYDILNRTMEFCAKKKHFLAIIYEYTYINFLLTSLSAPIGGLFQQESKVEEKKIKQIYLYNLHEIKL